MDSNKHRHAGQAPQSHPNDKLQQVQEQLDQLSSLLRQIGQSDPQNADKASPEDRSDLAERREHTRHQVNMNATIMTNGQETAASVQDISCGGIRLADFDDLAIGEEVTVRLESGQEIQGSAVWQKDNQIGVRFDEALDENDPLFNKTRPNGK